MVTSSNVTGADSRSPVATAKRGTRGLPHSLVRNTQILLPRSTVLAQFYHSGDGVAVGAERAREALREAGPVAPEPPDPGLGPERIAPRDAARVDVAQGAAATRVTGVVGAIRVFAAEDGDAVGAVGVLVARARSGSGRPRATRTWRGRGRRCPERAGASPRSATGPPTRPGARVWGVACAEASVVPLSCAIALPYPSGSTISSAPSLGWWPTAWVMAAVGSLSTSGET